MPQKSIVCASVCTIRTCAALRYHSRSWNTEILHFLDSRVKRFASLSLPDTINLTKKVHLVYECEPSHFRGASLSLGFILHNTSFASALPCIELTSGVFSRCYSLSLSFGLVVIVIMRM